MKFVAQSVRPDYPGLNAVAFLGYSNSKEVSTHLGITLDFPVVAVIKDDKVIKFESTDLTFEKLMAFAQENAGPHPTVEHAKKHPPQQKTPQRVLELYTVENEEQWNKACPNSPRGICFLAFLNPSDELHVQYTEILKNIAEKHAQLHVSYVNREKLPNFSNSFNIGEMNPQVVVFQRGTLRVKKF